jgi:hypothetical protein
MHSDLTAPEGSLKSGPVRAGVNDLVCRLSPRKEIALIQERHSGPYIMAKRRRADAPIGRGKTVLEPCMRAGHLRNASQLRVAKEVIERYTSTAMVSIVDNHTCA